MTTRSSWILGLGVGVIAAALGAGVFLVRGFLLAKEVEQLVVTAILTPTPAEIERRKAVDELNAVRRRIAELKTQRDENLKEWVAKLERARTKRDDAKLVWGGWQEKIRSEGARRPVVEGLREAYANYQSASNAVVSARAEVDARMQDTEEMAELLSKEAKLRERASRYDNPGRLYAE